MRYSDHCRSTCRRGYLISILLIGSLILRVGHTLCKAILVDPNSYNFTEFLISYEGGFVRRGLLGQLLYWLCEITNMSPFGIISGISLCAWIIFLLYFFKKFHALNYSWWLLASPLFWGPPGSVVRKDYLCFLLIIGMLYLIKNRKIDIVRYILLCIMAFTGMFLHEAFIFFGIPIVSLVLISNKDTHIKGILFTGLNCVLFLIFCYFKGDVNVSNTIIQSWNSLLGTEVLSYNIKNSIEALGRDAIDQFIFHMRHNICEYNGNYFGWSGIIIRPLFAIVTYYLLVNFIFVFKKFDFNKEVILRTNLSLLYLFSIACLLPMFIFLSCDYGRLYQYAVVASLSAFVILPQPSLAMTFPKRIRAMIEHFNLTMNRLIIPSKGLMVVLLFIVAPTPSCFIPGHAFISSILGNYCNLINVVFEKLIF